MASAPNASDNGLNGVSSEPNGVDLVTFPASLVGESKGPKIRVFKHKRRNTQRKTIGHRQHYHRVRIDEIQLP